jgi:hypothetical protein
VSLPADPCPHLWTPPGFDDDGPADPDRPWAWRDSGHGDEDRDDIDEGGPIDTDSSYRFAAARFPCLVAG